MGWLSKWTDAWVKLYIAGPTIHLVRFWNIFYKVTRNDAILAFYDFFCWKDLPVFFILFVSSKLFSMWPYLANLPLWFSEYLSFLTFFSPVKWRHSWKRHLRAICIRFWFLHLGHVLLLTGGRKIKIVVKVLGEWTCFTLVYWLFYPSKKGGCYFLWANSYSLVCHANFDSETLETQA